MKNINTEEVNKLIYAVCQKYQEERVNGQWYITQTGLNKVSKLLGGNYKDLTKKQRAFLRMDCLNNSHMGTDIKSWWYYLNCI